MLLKQLNKIIRFSLTLSIHNKVVLFFCLLISLSASRLNAQTQLGDTLKKLTTDTISAGDNNDPETIEEQIKYSAEDSIVGLPGKGRGLLYGKAWITYG